MKRPTITGYKGRAYRLLWSGVVKKGKSAGLNKAHLASFDGKIDFWVDTAKLEAPPQSRRQCGECDGWDDHHYPDCCFQ
jgi:hypothetical protein